MSLLDLAPIADLEANLKRRSAPQPVAEVAFLDSPLGPGLPWPERMNWRSTFPLPYPSRTVPAGFVMARLAPDPYMRVTLANWDIALLDTTTESRLNTSPHGLYAVTRGEDAVLRYIRPGARCFYLLADATWDQPGQWEQLRTPAAGLPNFVKGRVRWLGRERDRAAAHGGRFLYDAISS